MAVYDLYPRASAPRLCRASRIASLVLLTITVLALLGSDLPAAEALITHTFHATCFLLMLFGLMIAWRHPLQGGVLTTLAWAPLSSVAEGTSALVFAVFLAVGLLNLAAGCCGDGRPADA